MPFCSQCGNRVTDRDVYCGRCGAQQPVDAPRPSGAPPAASDALSSISPRTAAILCYLPGLGWVASIIVLAAERFRHDRKTRFHAFQGLYLFVAWLISDWVLRPMFSALHMHLGGIVQAILLAMCIFMMVKASHNETYELPVFGELANRSIAED